MIPHHSGSLLKPEAAWLFCFRLAVNKRDPLVVFDLNTHVSECLAKQSPFVEISTYFDTLKFPKNYKKVYFCADSRLQKFFRCKTYTVFRLLGVYTVIHSTGENIFLIYYSFLIIYCNSLQSHLVWCDQNFLTQNKFYAS